MRALEIALSDLLIEFSGTSFPKKKMPKPAFLLSELQIEKWTGGGKSTLLV